MSSTPTLQRLAVAPEVGTARSRLLEESRPGTSQSTGVRSSWPAGQASTDSSSGNGGKLQPAGPGSGRTGLNRPRSRQSHGVGPFSAGSSISAETRDQLTRMLHSSTAGPLVAALPGPRPLATGSLGLGAGGSPAPPGTAMSAPLLRLHPSVQSQSPPAGSSFLHNSLSSSGSNGVPEQGGSALLGQPSSSRVGRGTASLVAFSRPSTAAARPHTTAQQQGNAEGQPRSGVDTLQQQLPSRVAVKPYRTVPYKPGTLMLTPTQLAGGSRPGTSSRVHTPNTGLGRPPTANPITHALGGPADAAQQAAIRQARTSQAQQAEAGAGRAASAGVVSTSAGLGWLPDAARLRSPLLSRGGLSPGSSRGTLGLTGLPGRLATPSSRVQGGGMPVVTVGGTEADRKSAVGSLQQRSPPRGLASEGGLGSQAGTTTGDNGSSGPQDGVEEQEAVVMDTNMLSGDGLGTGASTSERAGEIRAPSQQLPSQVAAAAALAPALTSDNRPEPLPTAEAAPPAGPPPRPSTTSSSRPATGVSEYSTQALALGQGGAARRGQAGSRQGLRSVAEDDDVDSVDLAMQRIRRANQDDEGASINLMDDVQSLGDVDELLPAPTIGAPSRLGGGPGGRNRGLIPFVGTKAGAKGRVAARDAAKAAMTQAAPMVLSLEDLTQSTPEVLEMEMGRMTLEELLDLDAKSSSSFCPDP